MMEPVVMTRQCRATEFELLGVAGQALERLLKETARERHLSRVAYAQWSAEEFYLRLADGTDRESVSEETLKLATGAILWSDVIGVGGWDGVEGFSTTRHPAFVACGKGRKHASDGGAWSAAILEAARGCPGYFGVSKGVLVYSNGGEIEVGKIIPHQWCRSIIREGLRRAAGLPPWHPEVPFNAPPESVSTWATLYNTY